MDEATLKKWDEEAAVLLERIRDFVLFIQSKEASGRVEKEDFTEGIAEILWLGKR